MLDPVVQSALVVLVTVLLELGARALNIELDVAVLRALAGAIVAWLLGVPAGSRVAEGVRESVRGFRARG